MQVNIGQLFIYVRSLLHLVSIWARLPEPGCQQGTGSICTWRPRRSSSLWMVTEDTQRLSPPCSALPMDSMPTMSMQNWSLQRSNQYCDFAACLVVCCLIATAMDL